MPRTVYRVFPHLPGAAPTERGGALFIPAKQGAGRIDNPDLYLVMYVADNQVAAIAETLATRSHVWAPASLRGPKDLPGSALAMGVYAVPDNPAILELDDPTNLSAHGLRPSEVITKDYTYTQTWARRIFRTGSWRGVSWWSYYEARWTSMGLWTHEDITPVDVIPLTLAHPAVKRAASALGRTIRP